MPNEEGLKQDLRAMFCDGFGGAYPTRVLPTLHIQATRSAERLELLLGALHERDHRVVAKGAMVGRLHDCARLSALRLLVADLVLALA